MNARPSPAVEWTSLVVWPAIWVIGYYALTLWSVWGRPVHPIEAMFLMFGMLVTGGLAVMAALLWLHLLSRRALGASVSVPALVGEVAFGALSGASIMTVLVALFQLLLLGELGAVQVLGAVSAASAAGAISALLTSAIAFVRQRLARSRASATPTSS